MKALTREDLLYILNSVFTLSKDSNNAFVLKPDGLYVEDYRVHSNQANLHVPSPEVHEILQKLSTNELGQLLYDGNPASIAVSQEANNSLEIKADGLYVKLVPQAVQAHMEDTDVHITTEERQAWNKSVQDANDYTDDEIRKLQIHKIAFVEDLPEGDLADPLTVYLYKDENTAEDFTIAVYTSDGYRTLNITKKTLNKYYTKTEIDEKVQHLNDTLLKKTVADDTYLHSEDYELDHGRVVQKGKKILSSRANNGLSCDEDGGLYYPDLQAEIHSIEIAAAFSKRNLLDEEITTAGLHNLKDDINNYNLILIEYYYKPDEDDLSATTPVRAGYAKTAIADPDTLEFLSRQGVDYCLEVGYGVSSMNTKISIHDDVLTVNYYHNICIYKITGIGRRGGGD